MDVLVTGAGGFIGHALIPALRAAGHRPIVAVRGRAVPTDVDGIAWDPGGGRIDAAALEGIGAGVHLAGAGIGDRRWTDERKQVILDSRTTGTSLLAETLAHLDRPPSVLVSASAIGYYGDRGDEVLTEDSSSGADFLAEVCRKWEAATAPATDAGIRVVSIRNRDRARTRWGNPGSLAAPVPFGPRRTHRIGTPVPELDHAYRRGPRHRARD